MSSTEPIDKGCWLYQFSLTRPAQRAAIGMIGHLLCAPQDMPLTDALRPGDMSPDVWTMLNRLRAMKDSGEPIDAVTLLHALERSGLQPQSAPLWSELIGLALECASPDEQILAAYVQVMQYEGVMNRIKERGGV